ncbi:thioredoxin family protein [Patescibacteria group bacterium]|nr:thioredoxin family protein [Patescibacteria group bacterium]
MADNKVTIYTTPTCVYCKTAKEFFKENNVEYSEKNVAVDMDAQQEMVQKSGQMAVPVIDVNGEVVIGFDKEKLSELLGVSA